GDAGAEGRVEVLDGASGSTAVQENAALPVICQASLQGSRVEAAAAAAAAPGAATAVECSRRGQEIPESAHDEAPPHDVGDCKAEAPAHDVSQCDPSV
ncbi:unnamed protein product, partial [Chrysoparadoxa australica]